MACFSCHQNDAGLELQSEEARGHVPNKTPFRIRTQAFGTF
jgi:hypothetical protein